MQPPEDMQVLVHRLMADDNAVRNAAEDTFTQNKHTDPDGIVEALIGTFDRAPSSPHIRQFIMTQLRRLLISKDPPNWTSLKDDSKKLIKVKLLSYVSFEKERPVLRLICEVIVNINFWKEPWQEVLPTLFSCATSEDSMCRFASFVLFGDLAMILEPGQFRPYFDLIRDILQKGLGDPNIQCKTSALNATASFLQVLREPRETENFRMLLPLMLQCTAFALQSNMEDEAKKSLEVFVELAGHAPFFFTPNISSVIESMLAIAITDSYPDSCRHTAMEVLISLIEEKPGLMRKQPNFITSLLSLLMRWLVSVEDDAEWYQFDDDNTGTYSEVAEQALDRISCALGGKHVVPILFPEIQAFVSNNTDWKHRFASVLALSTCAEGCQYVLKNHIPEVLKFILGLLPDPHPRVRWMCLNCIGQFCSDLGPGFQKHHSSEIFTSTLPTSSDTCTRVQAALADMIAGYCETIEKQTLVPHLSAVLHHLLIMLQPQMNNVKLLESVIGSISAIVELVMNAFEPYYDTFAPILKNLMKSAKAKEYRTIRGRAIECLSLMGVAVGKERFFKDAGEVMQEILHTPAIEADDPQMNYFEAAFARIAECLQQEFSQYLDLVMPSSLKRASVTANVQVFDEKRSMQGWEMYRVGEKSIGIHTSVLEEKAEAIHILLVYATQLRHAFLPYVQAVTDIVLTAMDFIYHEGVRIEACTAAPVLIDCVRAYLEQQTNPDPTPLNVLFSAMVSALINALANEPDREVMLCQLKCLDQAIGDMRQRCLTAEQVQNILILAAAVLDDWKERNEDRLATKKDEGHTEEDDEKLTEEDALDRKIARMMVEVMRKVVEHHSDVYMAPFKSELVPIAVQLLADNRQAFELQRAICIFDDVIEFYCPGAIEFFPTIVPFLVKYSGHKDYALRQACVFGLGACGLYAGEAFAPYIADSLRVLDWVIQQPGSRIGDDLLPTENAISAVLKIIVGQETRINVAEMLPKWLSYLPIVEDDIEGPYCYDHLCGFIERGNTYILGNQYQNIPHIIKVFAQAVNTEAVTPIITARMSSIITNLQSRLPPATIQSVWLSLTPQEQSNLQFLHSPPPHQSS
ncbi:ARM family protein [Pelomyxa schiedti]|nr:ARM family protein [Pelomyxa schiedti]